MPTRGEYRRALHAAVPALERRLKKPGMQGVESILRDSLARALGERAKTEVAYATLGVKGSRWHASNTTKLDILVDSSVGVELKVVAFPRTTSVHPNGCFWDIGQISGDVLRLQDATKLSRRQIAVLLVGPLVRALRTPGAIRRELHNRFFVDFSTSKSFGELHSQLKDHPRKPQRKAQVDVLKHLGVTAPYSKDKRQGEVVVQDGFALWFADVSAR